MDELTVTEKYSLCMLREVKSFMGVEFSIHLVTSMIIEMMLEDNLEIVNYNKEKSFILNDKFKVILNAKAPKSDYNRILYNYIKDMNKEEISLRDIITNTCYGKSGFSDKKYREIVNALKDDMVNKKLISLSMKKILFFNHETIKISDDKFDDVVKEIREQFLNKDIFSDEVILLASLLNSTNFLKNIVYKYEKGELKNKLKQIEDTDISKQVKIARDLILAMTADVYS